MQREKMKNILAGSAASITDLSDGAKRAQSFRKLLVQQKIDMPQFEVLLDKYMSQRQASARDEAAIRHNFVLELTANKMSIKVYNKAMDLLGLPHDTMAA